MKKKNLKKNLTYKRNWNDKTYKSRVKESSISRDESDTDLLIALNTFNQKIYKKFDNKHSHDITDKYIELMINSS
jgi:hypothetical protein